mgnify:CR=1 FL=1
MRRFGGLPAHARSAAFLGCGQEFQWRATPHNFPDVCCADWFSHACSLSSKQYPGGLKGLSFNYPSGLFQDRLTRPGNTMRSPHPLTPFGVHHLLQQDLQRSPEHGRRSAFNVLERLELRGRSLPCLIHQSAGLAPLCVPSGSVPSGNLRRINGPTDIRPLPPCLPR